MKSEKERQKEFLRRKEAKGKDEEQRIKREELQRKTEEILDKQQEALEKKKEEMQKNELKRKNVWYFSEKHIKNSIYEKKDACFATEGKIRGKFEKQA